VNRPLACAIALAMMTVPAASCLVSNRAPDFECSTTTDCTDGRICTSGYCVVGEEQEDCPSPCTSCDLGTMDCTVDCSEGSCGDLTCPTGFDCTVNCDAGSCGDIDCGGAESCTVNCEGGGACGNVTCGAGECDIDCQGGSACGDVSCADSCQCDVTCANATSCGTVSCPTSDTGDPCTDADGCDSGPTGCEKTCP